MLPNIHIGEEIRKRLDVQQRSVNWLADKIGCDQSNLNKRLKTPHLHAKWMYLISKALKINLFAPYSQSLYNDEMMSEDKELVKNA